MIFPIAEKTINRIVNAQQVCATDSLELVDVADTFALLTMESTWLMQVNSEIRFVLNVHRR